MKKKTIFFWMFYTLVVMALIYLTKGFSFPSGGDTAQGGFQLICWTATFSPVILKLFISPIAKFLAQRNQKRV